jgi:hypothetical protein
LTPLYSGIAQKITDISKKSKNYIGGYFIDNFTFGVTDPIDCDSNPNLCDNSYSGESSSSGIITRSEISYIYSEFISNYKIRVLRDMIGVSSCDLLNALYQPTNYIPFLTSQTVSPRLSLNVFNFLNSRYSQNNNNIVNISEKINIISDFISTKPINEFFPSYVIWGTLPLQKVTSDNLCNFNQFSNTLCNVPNGYDPNSCKLTYNESGPNCIVDSSYVSNADASSSINTPEYVSQNANLVDGKYSDNTGIISLLARGCKNIVAFINTDKQYVTINGSTATFNSSKFQQYDTDISPLFNSTNTNYVLDSGKLQSIITAFSTNLTSTSGITYAFQNITVQQNLTYNINSSYTVNILFILLQPSAKFNNLLDTSVTSLITYSNFGTDTKEFNYFPNYFDILQNYNNVNQTGFYGLTLPQSNLLTTYCDWSLQTIYNNDTTVKSFLNNL